MLYIFQYQLLTYIRYTDVFFLQKYGRDIEVFQDCAPEIRAIVPTSRRHNGKFTAIKDRSRSSNAKHDNNWSIDQEVSSSNSDTGGEKSTRLIVVLTIIVRTLTHLNDIIC